MPIYLYVKTHNQTGLKYLGKTTATDPHAYPGSGLIWQGHLKKYGSDYSTKILLETEDPEEIQTAGQYYSTLWNVVESDDWANLQPEEGQGFASGKYHHSKRPGYTNPAKLEENRQRASDRMKALGDKHISKTKEFKANMSGNRNPAHLPHVKQRMTEHNPRLLEHNVEKFRKIFTENNPMTRPGVVEKISGKNHYTYNPTIYSWRNIRTGEEVKCTRLELCQKYNLDSSTVGAILSKKISHTKGWTLNE
jgi:hypothetical protein